MFENVDGRTLDAGVIGILIAHLGAFESGELKHKEHSTQEKANMPAFLKKKVWIITEPHYY